MAFVVQRTIGNLHDALSCLWEGDDLPSFRAHNPYPFDDRSVADRVSWRLQARYPLTIDTPRIPSQPITYSVKEV
jgi:hypothetical protein